MILKQNDEDEEGEEENSLVIGSFHEGTNRSNIGIGPTHVVDSREDTAEEEDDDEDDEGDSTSRDIVDNRQNKKKRKKIFRTVVIFIVIFMT